MNISYGSFGIGEITINGFIGGSGFLADKIVAEGKRVVISGTDSLSLVKTSGSGLYHRCIIKNVTHISYREVKNYRAVFGAVC